ncbi:MAG TPA: YceI family protein [Chitinophagaceae bacterium]|nr:YceI family protein [Chitinophagaceae bacterium]
MRAKNTAYLVVLSILISGYAYIAACTHKDEVVASNGANIQRGTLTLTLDPINNPNLVFEKSHSNVGWETPYAGSLSLLTGRFNSFGFNSFKFDESHPENTAFEAWVQLNTVNTSEPGRDTGCLLKTYHTGKIGTIDQNVDSNLAVLKTTSVQFSPTDKGYIVTGTLKFNGVTNAITGKLTYDGSAPSGTKTKYGFSFNFQILANTDYLLNSTNIADNVQIKCNAIFTYTP